LTLSAFASGRARRGERADAVFPLECDLVYGLVPWQRSLEDRAMELVEQELWRKRYWRQRS
jgi:hypothetical protein